MWKRLVFIQAFITTDSGVLLQLITLAFVLVIQDEDGITMKNKF